MMNWQNLERIGFLYLVTGRDSVGYLLKLRGIWDYFAVFGPSHNACKGFFFHNEAGGQAGRVAIIFYTVGVLVVLCLYGLACQKALVSFYSEKESMG